VPPDDLLVSEVARLQGAFVELGRAVGAVEAGDAVRAKQGIASVRRAVERASRANDEGRSLCDQSDDIRSTVRILEAQLARRVAPPPSRGGGNRGSNFRT